MARPFRAKALQKFPAVVEHTLATFRVYQAAALQVVPTPRVMHPKTFLGVTKHDRPMANTTGGIEWALGQPADGHNAARVNFCLDLILRSISHELRPQA